MSVFLRLTPAMRAVLHCLVSADEQVWGLRVAEVTGLKTGTVYPLLERLERQGIVRSAWDDDSTSRGPRRRLYVLTDPGKEWANSRLRRSDEHGGST